MSAVLQKAFVIQNIDDRVYQPASVCLYHILFRSSFEASGFQKFRAQLLLCHEPLCRRPLVNQGVPHTRQALNGFRILKLLNLRILHLSHHVPGIQEGVKISDICIERHDCEQALHKAEGQKGQRQGYRSRAQSLPLGLQRISRKLSFHTKQEAQNTGIPPALQSLLFRTADSLQRCNAAEASSRHPGREKHRHQCAQKGQHKNPGRAGERHLHASLYHPVCKSVCPGRQAGTAQSSEYDSNCNGQRAQSNRFLQKEAAYLPGRSSDTGEYAQLPDPVIHKDCIGMMNYQDQRKAGNHSRRRKNHQDCKCVRGIRVIRVHHKIQVQQRFVIRDIFLPQACESRNTGKVLIGRGHVL